VSTLISFVLTIFHQLFKQTAEMSVS